MQEFVLKDSKYRMRYHDFPGEDTPILFIHGLGCAGSFDYPQVAAQKELSGYRRILIDLLGSGFSDKPSGFGYTVRDHAEYLLDFVTQLGYISSLFLVIVLVVQLRFPWQIVVETVSVTSFSVRLI